MANTIIIVHDGNVEAALAKLKKWAVISGFYKMLRSRSFYTKPGERRRLKSRMAQKKARKAQRRIAVAEARNDR